MDEISLSVAPQAGNISDLYRLIERDGNILRRFDEVEFINTPLHIAAEGGCIDFAMEIMSLKPSFARKLNHQGMSPIHLAAVNGHEELVLRLCKIDKDLVRVKGKKGETLLHFVLSRKPNLEFLAKLLEICPECIRDVTTENETALHLATRNNELEALKLLCKMLMKTQFCVDVVNQKDKIGDTALHIAARGNRHEMLILLLKCKADKHATNRAGKTALDIAERLDSIECNQCISILRGFFPGVSTFIYKLRKQILKNLTIASSIIFQDMDKISSDERNALLVILGLLLTATYQGCLSPPGGVWQGNISPDQSPNTTNTINIVGKSVMDETRFLYFYIPTSAVFIVTFSLTLGLLKPYPRGFRTALQLLLAFLAISFYNAIFYVAPTLPTVRIINLYSLLVFLLTMFICSAYRVSNVSVIIIIFWLFPIGVVESLIAFLIVGIWLFLFVRDKYWKRIALLAGYCSLTALYQQGYIPSVFRP